MLEIVQHRKKIIPLGWTGRFNKHCATRIRTKQKGNIYFESPPLKQFSVSLSLSLSLALTTLSLPSNLTPSPWLLISTYEIFYSLYLWIVAVQNFSEPITPVTSLSVCRLIASHFTALNPPTVCPYCSVALQHLHSSRNQRCSPQHKTVTVNLYQFQLQRMYWSHYFHFPRNSPWNMLRNFHTPLYKCNFCVIHCIAFFLLQ